MRYTLESALPIKAFSPRCRGPFARGMTLEGGGGGGGWNPISAVSDAVSSVGDALASIDPGPAIGDAGAAVDQAVNDAIPGGWATVGAVAATIATAGALSETIPAAAGADAAMTTGDILASTGFTPTVGSGASFAIDPAIAYTTGAAGTGALADTVSSLPSLTDPSLTTQIGAPATSGSTFGSLTPPLTGSGAIPGAGAVTDAAGLTGALPSGVVVGDGTGGTIMGATYIDAGGGIPALDMFGNPVEASSIGIGGIDTSSGLSLSDLNNARKLYNLAQSLTGSSGTRTMSRSALTPYTTLGSGADAGASTPSITNIASPKGTIIHGQQIASQMPSILDATSPAYAPPQSAFNPIADFQLIQNAAEGGYIQHMNVGGLPLPMTDVRMRGRQTGFGAAPHAASLTANILGHAAGGEIEGHNPTFFSVGGLNSLDNTYVQGEGDGTSDNVAAMLADGEFVIPADVVSKIGNGSSNAGAKVLDQFLETVREHAQKHDPKDLPPSSKGPLAYLKEAERKVNA